MEKKTEQTINSGKSDFIGLWSTRFGHTVTFVRTKNNINFSYWSSETR